MKAFKKFLTVTTALFGIVAAIGLIAAPIVSQFKLLPNGTQMITTGTRTYELFFVVDDGTGEKLFWQTGKVKRGEKFDYTELNSMPDPTYNITVEDGYFKFLGWDYTGDGLADILPKRAWLTTKVNAVFFIYEPEPIESGSEFNTSSVLELHL